MKFYLKRIIHRTSQKTAEAFSAKLSDKLHRSPTDLSDIGELWDFIPSRTTAAAVLGFERPPQRNRWYDEDCRSSYASHCRKLQKEEKGWETRFQTQKEVAGIVWAWGKHWLDVISVASDLVSPPSCLCHNV